MCGRFNVINNPELQQLLKELGIDLGLPSRSNVAPTEDIALVRALDGDNELTEMRWWLIPRWAKQLDQKYSMFNARSENLDKSRAFSQAFKHRRGIVPVSNFIEWRSETGGRQPYVIGSAEGALALAAIWEHWEGEGRVIESCALVTTAAAPEFEQIHQRMPVILAGEERERWLDCSHSLAVNDPLFEPRLKCPMLATPVSRGINNARNKEPELLEPTGEPISLGGGGLVS